MNKVNPVVNTDRFIRILFVDDDPALLEVTALLLAHQGYLVTPAIGGKEAITKIKDKPDEFDVVLTDYSMPIINGLELAILIKKLSFNIPVILCTGKPNLIDERQIAEAGIASIAPKPCTIQDLDSIIKKVLNTNVEAYQ